MRGRTELGFGGSVILVAGLVSLCCCVAASGQQREAKPKRSLRQQIEAAPRRTTQTPLAIQLETVQLPSSEELAAVEIEPDLDRIVSRMGDSLYSNREEATAELLERGVDLLQLYAALARGGLTPEQRHRILSVIQDRLLNTPRGAVGIKVDQRWLPDEIVIQQLLPNLPAREVLEVGDRVTHLDGEPLESWNAFVKSVQSRLPGSRIAITIKRPRENRVAVEKPPPGPEYEVIELEFDLGSADLLRDPVTGRPQRGGPVYDERKREAELAMDRWGADPKEIDLE